MDPFVFVIALVAVISAGRTLRAVLVETIRRRPLPEGDAREGGVEIEGYRETMEGVMSRLERLEEERDFYRELLDAPAVPEKIPPPPAEGN